MTELFTSDEFADALALMLTEARRDSPERLLVLLSLLREALGTTYESIAAGVTAGKLEEEGFFNEVFAQLKHLVADGGMFLVPAQPDGAPEGAVAAHLARLKVVWSAPLPPPTTTAGKQYVGIRPVFA